MRHTAALSVLLALSCAGPQPGDPCTAGAVCVDRETALVCEGGELVERGCPGGCEEGGGIVHCDALEDWSCVETDLTQGRSICIGDSRGRCEYLGDDAFEWRAHEECPLGCRDSGEGAAYCVTDSQCQSDLQCYEDSVCVGICWPTESVQGTECVEDGECSSTGILVCCGTCESEC